MQSVTVDLNFVVGTTNNEPLYRFTPRIHQHLPEGTPVSNAVSETRSVEIQSLAGTSHKFNLEKNGFQLGDLSSAVKDWTDADEIRLVYYPEVAEMMTKVTGGSRVYVFDHVTRGITPQKDESVIALKGPAGPVLQAHVDFTERSGPQRVKRFLGDDAERLLRGRFAIVQVWKPLRDAVLDTTLAMADATTVSPNDLVPSYLVYPDRVGEVLGVRYNPNQRWYYYPDLKSNQAYLFKCFDSKKEGTRFTPHSAFANPLAPEDAPLRQSIEVRALVFWDDQTEE